MQETRNNCFQSKKRSTTLLQAKTGKHKCRNITATALVLTCFSLKKGCATYFRPETIIVSFLHLMVILFKVLSFIIISVIDVASKGMLARENFGKYLFIKLVVLKSYHTTIFHYNVFDWYVKHCYKMLK